MAIFSQVIDRPPDERGARASAYVVLIPVAGFLLIYLPGVGHGFVKDDFSWILESRLNVVGDVLRIFTQAPNFYRPIVSLSFGLTDLVVGPEAFWYGLTNIVLCILAAWSISRFGTSLRLSYGASIVAAAIWAFNFHGINMAVLWNSGRTALFLTLFSVLAGTDFLKRRYTATAAWVLLALLSKEEAVVVPLILTAWAVIERPDKSYLERIRLGLSQSAVIWLCLVAYFLIRSGTHAFTPSTAPSFYRFDFSAARLGVNGLQYLDRAATFPAAIVILGCLVMYSRPMVPSGGRRAIIFGGVWFILGYAPTIFLPVRSSLYACLPSVGSSLAAGSLVHAAWRQSHAKRRRYALWLALAFPFLLWPIYNSRNERWVELADLSHNVMPDLTKAARGMSETGTLLLLDDTTTRANVSAAFGTLLPDAVRLFSGKTVRIWVEPPLPEADLAGLHRPRTGDIDIALELRDGRLRSVRKNTWKPN